MVNIGEIRSDWLTCNNCKRRGKYTFNTGNVLYDYRNKRLILNWDLACKFCNASFKPQNLADSSISMLYIVLVIRNIDGSV